MKTRDNARVRLITPLALARLIVVLTITCAFQMQATAQTTPADTPIENTATATYNDTTGGNYTATSNKVTVTVSKVSGLAITPDTTDGTSDPTVVAGQQNVRFVFVVTNTGNFTDDVRFLSNGASVQIASGMATVASAFVDFNSNNTFEAGTDVNINDAAADLVSFTQGQSRNVVVYINVNAAAPAGSIINVRLGDADNGTPYDNEQVDATTANEVRTESNASVNGRLEARGDRSTTVENDAQLTLSLTAPAGPVPLGSNITYVWQVCNTGSRAASAVTLTNVSGAPAGGNTGVFIFAPVPAGTTLASPQVFPAGTLYSNSAVTDNPVTTAQWYAAPPAGVTRIAFKVGNSLAATAGSNCSANLNQIVTITTTDATNPITEQGSAYALNSVNAQINTTSPLRTTLLEILGNVLNGPQNAPGAVNNNDDDDFTNKSIDQGIAGVAPGGGTTLADSVTFTNTVQNTGNANDTYTLTVQSFPAGADVTVTVGGVPTLVIDNGAATGNAVPPLSVAFNDTEDYQVLVSLPAGTTVLTGYDTVIRATSANTNTEWNETIDRVYTGFIRLLKTATILNETTVGNGSDDPGPDDPVPGAQIIFAITYRNVSSAQMGSGNGNVQLTATNIVITENGTPGPGNPNNWANYTIHVVGATDTNGGVITGDALLSTVLTDTVASLLPQTEGTFTFKRLIQ